MACPQTRCSFRLFLFFFLITKLFECSVLCGLFFTSWFYFWNSHSLLITLSFYLLTLFCSSDNQPHHDQVIKLHKHFALRVPSGLAFSFPLSLMIVHNLIPLSLLTIPKWTFLTPFLFLFSPEVSFRRFTSWLSSLFSHASTWHSYSLSRL